MNMRAPLLLTLIIISTGVTWAQGDDALTVAAQQVADRFVQAAEAKRGEVAEVDTTTSPVTLYVLLGQDDGVQEGQLLNVISRGDPIVVAGETVGFREKPVGTAVITRIQSERLSVATMRTTIPGQLPAKGNMAYVKAAPSTLAVSTFLRPDNAATLMGQELADKLGMALQATGRFRMVERTRLEAALGELKLGLNDLFDPAKAARIGQLLQAKGVVLGTITQQNDRYSINVRVVDIETGTQVLTAATVCGRSDELDAKYSQVVAGGSGPAAVATAEPEDTAPAVVRLFDAFTPITTGGGFDRKTLGTCPIGGRLYDDCVGYRKGGVRGHVIFDLKDSSYSELTATCGGYESEVQYGGGGDLTVQCDGRTAFDARIDKNAPPRQLRVDIRGVRQLRIEVTGCGIVVPGDFQLVR